MIRCRTQAIALRLAGQLASMGFECYWMKSNPTEITFKNEHEEDIARDLVEEWARESESSTGDDEE